MIYKPDLSQEFDSDGFTAPDPLSAVITNIPPLDYDEFMPYEQPVMPVMLDFNTELMVNTRQDKGLADPVHKPHEPHEPHEPDNTVIDPGEIEPSATDTGENIDIVIQDASHIKLDTALMINNMEVEIPQVERLKAGINKVNLDTYTFNERRMARIHNIAIISIMTAAIVFLTYYLLHQ